MGGGAHVRAFNPRLNARTCAPLTRVRVRAPIRALLYNKAQIGARCNRTVEECIAKSQLFRLERELTELLPLLSRLTVGYFFICAN